MSENQADYVSESPTLTPSEVAKVFRVSVCTVTRWARSGKLQSFRTAGGHRRFRVEDVEALKASRAGE